MGRTLSIRIVVMPILGVVGSAGIALGQPAPSPRDINVVINPGQSGGSAAASSTVISDRDGIEIVASREGQDAPVELSVRRASGEQTVICSLTASNAYRCRPPATVLRDATAFVVRLPEPVRSETRLRISIQTLPGPELEGTGRFGGEARSFQEPVGPAWSKGIELRAAEALVFRCTSAVGAPALLDLVSNSDLATFSVRVHDEKGALVSATVASAPQHTLVIPKISPTFFVQLARTDASESTAQILVALHPVPNAASIGELTDQLSQRITEKRLPVPADGLAFRRSVTASTYDALLRFGEFCGPIGERLPGCNASAEIETFLAEVAAFPGMRVPSGQRSKNPFMTEPFVVFIGLGSQTAIVALYFDREGVHVRRSTFKRPRYFWAVYAEDDTTPYDTSIDVEFKERSSSSDVEQFDPSSLGRMRTVAAGDGNGRRLIKVGVRRFRMRRPPVSTEVAFTRQGLSYGIRQWRRTFRTVSWNPFGFGAAVFAAGTEIALHQHEFQPINRLDEKPATQVAIIQTQQHTPVFATGYVTLPRARTAVLETGAFFKRSWWGVLPDFHFGLGMPPHRQPTLFTGLTWPIVGDRLHFGVGYAHIKENKIRPEHWVGQRVDLPAAPDGRPLTPDIGPYQLTDWIHILTVGLSVDVKRFW